MPPWTPWLVWFYFFIFFLPNPWRGSVDLGCQMGLLSKSLIMSEQLDRIVKCWVDIKWPNTNFTGMHVLPSDYQMRLHLSCFILYHSLTITLYVQIKHKNIIFLEPICRARLFFFQSITREYFAYICWLVQDELETRNQNELIARCERKWMEGYRWGMTPRQGKTPRRDISDLKLFGGNFFCSNLHNVWTAQW